MFDSLLLRAVQRGKESALEQVIDKYAALTGGVTI